jgi:hypothetical protein
MDSLRRFNRWCLIPSRDEAGLVHEASLRFCGLGLIEAPGTLKFFRPSPFPGAAIADTQRAGIRNSTFEILTSDGTPLGTIMATGLFAGVAPPGAPLDAQVGNDAIVGGTGAFLGARGYAGQAAQTVPPRRASITEDPGNRRRHGGGKTRYVLQVIPLARPEILTTSSGPTSGAGDPLESVDLVSV